VQQNQGERVKIQTIASGMTHLLLASLLALGAAKYAQQSGKADAGDIAQPPPAPDRRAGAQVTAQAETTRARTAIMVETSPQRIATDTLRPEDRAIAPLGPETGTADAAFSPHDSAAPAETSPAPADPARPAPQAAPEPPNADLMRRLVTAYPDFLAGFEDNTIIWHDGTRMRFDDGREKTFKERLSDPDLEDQFYAEYPRGLRGVPPLENIDPGRVRYEPFFKKMYGNCKENGGDVASNLEDVVWLPQNWGKTLRVTRVNGVADALRRVSAELDRLPKRFMKYLRPSAGTYHCRTIAGTQRFSVHAFGAAVDINAKYGDYWRWSNPKPGEMLAHRNRIPWDIVEIFERHGFIWGGKWYHYDTLHFEYRPELLNAPPPQPAPPPERRRRPVDKRAQR